MSLGKAVVNSSGDLAIDSDARKFIGKEVTVLRQFKSGLYEVQLESGETYRLPKRNLNFKE